MIKKLTSLFSILLLLVVVFGSPKVARAAITRVQFKSIDCGATSTCAPTFTSNVTAGNSIIVAVSAYYGGAGNNGRPWTVSDTRSSTWNTAYSSGDGEYPTMSIFYADNITGGADTVTVTAGVATYWDVTVVEYSGLLSSGSLDTSHADQLGSGSSGTTYNSGNLATAQASELLFGLNHCYSVVTATPDSPWNIIENLVAISSTHMDTQDQIVSSTGNYADSGTFNVSCSLLDSGSPHPFVIASFKAAAGGGGAVAVPTVQLLKGVMSTNKGQVIIKKN